MGPRLTAGVLLALVLVTGCSSDPERPAATATFGPTDVMFAQMALEQIHEGTSVAEVVGARTGDPRVRAVATALETRWRADSGTLQRWLLGWEQPLTAPTGAAAHAGHGDLHSLQPADLASLRASHGPAFDRTAVALLLGGLHNSVETTRMESAGGSYPPAVSLAGAMTDAYQEQIRVLLRVAAAS